jgi:hypothetical protein
MSNRVRSRPPCCLIESIAKCGKTKPLSVCLECGKGWNPFGYRFYFPGKTMKAAWRPRRPPRVPISFVTRSSRIRRLASCPTE